MPFLTEVPQGRRIIDYNGTTKVATVDSPFFGTDGTDYFIIYPASHFSSISAGEVNTEVVDALNVDTYAEPGQETPLATTTLADKINFIHKALRNKVTQTANTFALWNDGEDRVDQIASVGDDGTTFSRSVIDIGPIVEQMNLYSNIDEPFPEWSTFELTLTSGQAGPDGSNNAVRALTTTTNDNHTMALDQGANRFDLLNGETYIMEAEVKGVGGYHFGFQAWNSSFGSRVERSFNLTTGAIGTVSQTDNAPFLSQIASIEALGNDWYKCRMQFTMSADALDAYYFWKVYNASELGTFAGDITKGVVVNSARLLHVT
jgi:hypothetical protein